MLENMNRRFYAPEESGASYGYTEDTDTKVSPFSFGLNQGFRLTKFEWIANGGKDGAEQEALEIIFTKGETTRSYRQFPVVKAFKTAKDGGGEITDPTSPEFKLAVSEFNQRIAHIAHAFVDDAAYKAALARKIGSFKEFCNIVKSLFPKNTPEIELDIFMQYQWQLSGDAKRTYLDIPSKRKHGAFITKSVAPTGAWKPVLKETFDDNTQNALTYVDEAGKIHPFNRNGWFMASNFAHQQRIAGDTDANDASSTADAGANMNGTPVDVAPTTGASVPSTW